MRGDAEDDQAVRRVLSGDRDAFRFLVDRYGTRILSFCRARLRPEEEARDAAQEVFAHAFRSIGTFRLGESFPSWLFAIAANHLRSTFRAFSSYRKRIEAAGAEAATAAQPDPAGQAMDELDSEALRRAVKALPRDQRLPVQLYYFGQLSVAETAAALGLGEEAVKARLFRARKALRIALEDEQPATGFRGIDT